MLNRRVYLKFGVVMNSKCSRKSLGMILSQNGKVQTRPGKSRRRRKANVILKNIIEIVLNYKIITTRGSFEKMGISYRSYEAMFKDLSHSYYLLLVIYYFSRLQNKGSLFISVDYLMQ